MSRKLISNQPLKEDLDDLENIDFFESQNKKVRFEDNEEEKQDPQEDDRGDNRNDREEEDDEPQHQVIRKTTSKRYHGLQVIDEDAEHFKAKLDNLINGFRNETLSEFMSIKRALLQEQTEAIEGESRKFGRLLENRTNELDRTKEALAKKIKEQERSEVIIHVVSDWAGIARTKRRNVLLLSKCFNGFKAYRESQNTQKQFKRMADTILKRKTVAKVFGSWKTSHVGKREENLKKDADSTLNKELADLAAKYNKEIDMLTSRLNEALRSLDEAERNKLEIQDNLKKAFMRGVCALNFEAMSILKHGDKGFVEESEQTMYNKQIENITQGNPNYHSLVLNPVDDNHSNADDFERSRGGDSPKKNIVFYQNPKLESKDMRWREAPVVGTSQQAEKKKFNSSILKPSTYPPKVENKENWKEENHHEEEERSLGVVENHGEDEGRVIKVNNGKSFGTTGTASGVSAKQTTKVNDKTVTVNANKAAQLRAQLGKVKK